MTRDERLLCILLAPVISEKSTEVGDKRRTAVFRVAADASKEEIRAAVEKLFEVKVNKVGVVSVRGKSKRFGRRGRTARFLEEGLCAAAGRV